MSLIREFYDFESTNEGLSPFQLKELVRKRKYADGEKVFVKKGQAVSKKGKLDKKFVKDYVNANTHAEIKSINFYATKATGEIKYEVTTSQDNTLIVSEDGMISIKDRVSVAEKASTLIEALIRKTSAHVEIYGSSKTAEGEFTDLKIKIRTYEITPIEETFYSKKDAEKYAEELNDVQKTFKGIVYNHRMSFHVKEDWETFSSVEDFYSFMEEQVGISASDENVAKLKNEYRGSTVGEKLGIL